MSPLFSLTRDVRASKKGRRLPHRAIAGWDVVPKLTALLTCYLPTALLGAALLATTAVGFDHPGTQVEKGFGQVAPAVAPDDGLDKVTPMGCQREQRPGVVAPFVVLSKGYSSKRLSFDAAWALVHQPGNAWNVTAFCYGVK
jgi:hypothetical protein